MASLSEQLREIQDDGLCNLCLITIVSDAEALESELAEVTAQRDDLLKAMKIVTTGTIGNILEHLNEFIKLVSKCEVQNG